jgi:hypothetical protein
MARLFVTPREIDYISDLTKEITKDVRGQKIYYYRIREDLTDVHDIYEEAPSKVFDRPIEIEAMVEWEPESIKTTRFGHDEFYTITVYLHARDLMHRDITLKEGDFFSYGTTFFEITSIAGDKQVYGQVEHLVGYKLMGKQARQGAFETPPLGPTGEIYTEEDAVQKEFVQQRGLKENKLGETGDKRDLIEQGKLEEPEAPAEISEKGDADGISSSFYDEPK